MKASLQTLAALALCLGMVSCNRDRSPVAGPRAKTESTVDKIGNNMKKNHLAGESSPYLQQHATNPVDWYPWGDEAFAKAKREDKPVFLSIGYSTCHWCHVMEHESFEDEDVAALLNEHFVAVKVDREERPDIDAVYMSVTQSMTGSGGWPMTVVMTPDKEPFFAGTYFPKSGQPGRGMGMLQLLPALSEAWDKRRDDVTKAARQATQKLQAAEARRSSLPLGADLPALAVRLLKQSYDERHGGFGRAPKFPTPHNLIFLLRQYHRSGDKELLGMITHTLAAMRQGGIYDHLGFGFHRYATDAEWLVPHFEKMLYDQAMLAMVYLEAYQITGTALYAQTAREIFSYVKTNMTSPEGAFYSAEDADSDGEEGKFYVWTQDEITGLLGKESAAFSKAYNVTAAGNYHDEATGQLTGTNILHLKAKDAVGDFEKARKVLLAHREKRIHPFKDDKVLTDWNGLMIAAYAKGAQVLNEPKYARIAAKAADFLLQTLRQPNGRLLKRYRDGKAGLTAHVDDYAFTVWGLLELYRASFEIKYLREAVSLNDTMMRHFLDDKGGLYTTPSDGEKLLVRQKEFYDGALPSGNSVAALNLLQLAHITGNERYAESATGILSASGKAVQEFPLAFTHLLSALDFQSGPVAELVVAGERSDRRTMDLLRAANQNHLPRTVLLLRSKVDADALARVAPFTSSLRATDGKPAAFVCRNSTCQLPTNDVKQMLKNLAGKKE